jgi:hypothetical protein
MKEDGYQPYGCFKHRVRVKSGYTALLRLFYASSLRKPRFSYPARITRVSPPWLYSTHVPHFLLPHLDEFLRGKRIELLHLLFESLLENEFIPQFMHPSLQEDFSTVQDFFKCGPRFTRKLKTRNGIRQRILMKKQMDRLIALEFTDQEALA